MAISGDRQQREQDKFKESTAEAGEVAVKVINPDGSDISGGAGGGDGAILDGVNSSIKATVVDYTNSNPLTVRLTDTNGDYAAAGGGTEYTEGDTDASITGKAVLAEGPGDTLTPLQVDASKNLQVDIAADSVGIGGGYQYDDGDAITTDSQGNLLIATTGISGTARAIRCDDDGAIHVADGGNALTIDGSVGITGQPITVDATNLDIRDLTSVSDSVEVLQNTPADLNMTEVNSGTIVGDTTSIDGKIPTVGQKTKAGSVPVTLASDEDTVNVTITGQPITIDADGSMVDVSSRALRDLGKVDVAGFDVALPSGSNAIGKLAANSGVDIGDVDVTSITLPEWQKDYDAVVAVDTSADLIFDDSAHTAVQRLILTNNGTVEVYVGEDSGVSSTDFIFYIPPKQFIMFDWAGSDLWAETASSSINLKVVGMKMV